jgi:3-dehydrotetronate 4-kinase
MLLGCIADDFTGATDLAGMLVANGMRAVQMIGVPDGSANIDADAVVIALKTRTVPAGDAVAQSLAALDWLRAQGARQFFFKYCSTFDSTPAGNIGPVADALLDALGADFTVATPAFPANGRTVFKGYLFVGDVLLNESGMQDHPLTPMTDANLVRVLAAQTPGRVGLVDHRDVAGGVAAIAARYGALRDAGVRMAVVDAVDDDDLRAIGAASKELALLTGGSGIAVGLPQNFRAAGLLGSDIVADALPPVGGRAAVISGSCSRATNEQVRLMQRERPSFAVYPLEIAAGRDVAGAALAWAGDHPDEGPLLVYATAEPERVRAVQEKLGAAKAGALVEETLAAIARGLVAMGVRRLVVAGGETSGAVVSGLGVTGLRIGPQIAPGVPWTVSLGSGPQLALALKSGNFGGPDFFAAAFAALDRLQER